MDILSLQRLYPFEALAEIFDFVAGLVQRVPKKPSIMKADLQNSTASQGDFSWEGFSCRAYHYGSRLLPLQKSHMVTRSRTGITVVRICLYDHLPHKKQKNWECPSFIDRVNFSCNFLLQDCIF